VHIEVIRGVGLDLEHSQSQHLALDMPVPARI